MTGTGIRLFAGVAVVAGLSAPAGRVSAQEEFSDACAAVTQDSAQRFCNLVGQAIYLTQPHFGLAFAGGNPVPGTASTLGRRFGIAPRVSGAGRLTLVPTKLPAIRERGDNMSMLVPTANADFTIGLISGLSILPTVGGFGSIDLLASAGIMRIPGGKGFDDGFPLSYAGGIRFGVLRESFTAPGISVTAMYRGMNNLEFGTTAFSANDSAHFRIEGMNVLSLRATASKRIMFLGATVGAGYDRFRSDARFSSRASGTSTPVLNVPGFTNVRTNVFANVSWTLLIASTVAELGFQSPGSRSTAPIPAGTENLTEKGTFFGSLALRIAI
jgi:hypothetical protein